MKANVGNPDRIIRIVIGALAAFGGFKTGGTTGVILYAVAAVALLTGALGWCGLYQLLGIPTSSGSEVTRIWKSQKPRRWYSSASACRRAPGLRTLRSFPYAL